MRQSPTPPPATPPHPDDTAQNFTYASQQTHPVYQTRPPAPDQAGSAQNYPQQAPNPPYMTPGARSHVTRAPSQVDGHNFNPQLRSQYANEPGVTHATRPIEPGQNKVSDELRKKHEKSVEQYPYLNLSEGEYVILRIQRHPIGLFIPIGVSTFLIIILLSVLVSYPLIVTDTVANTAPGFGLVVLMTLSLSVLVAIFGYIAVWVYLRNQFFLTNESVIQELQHSLFSKHEQTASLGSIEDVSYRQNGILQIMLNYGSIRLSTEGEETTYRFKYVSNPKKQTGTLTNAVEAFKNGRPVEG